MNRLLYFSCKRIFIRFSDFFHRNLNISKMEIIVDDNSPKFVVQIFFVLKNFTYFS